MYNNIIVKDREILLSICIPTYNRSNYLKICLNSIMSQVDINSPIEIIVSDNCSTDNSLEVIDEYINHPLFRLIKQERNLGPIINGYELISKHARGKFCWYVGDDDYIMNGAIPNIVDLISKNNEVDFFYVDIENHELDNKNISLENTLQHIKNKHKIEKIDFIKLEKFEELLHPKYSDLFLGEIMAAIFNRELWLSDKSILKHVDQEYLSTLETSYLHCVVFANQFMGKKAIYVATPIVLVDNRAREWSAKASYILVEHLLTLIQLYKKRGLNGKLYNACVKHYFRLTIPVILKFFLNRKLAYRNRISFFKYFVFVLNHPFLAIQTISSRLIKKVKK